MCRCPKRMAGNAAPASRPDKRRHGGPSPEGGMQRRWPAPLRPPVAKPFRLHQRQRNAALSRPATAPAIGVSSAHATMSPPLRGDLWSLVEGLILPRGPGEREDERGPGAWAAILTRAESGHSRRSDRGHFRLMSSGSIHVVGKGLAIVSPEIQLASSRAPTRPLALMRSTYVYEPGQSFAHANHLASDTRASSAGPPIVNFD